MGEITGRDFGRLEGKVDQLIDLIAERGTRMDGIDDRLRKAEGKISRSDGRNSVISVICASITTAILAIGTRMIHS